MRTDVGLRQCEQFGRDGIGIELKAAIAAAYEAIQAARDLIDQQMDGPCVMRDTLKAIETTIERVETEGFLMKALVDDLIPLMAIQATDNRYALDAVRRLRALLAAAQAAAPPAD